MFLTVVFTKYNLHSKWIQKCTRKNINDHNYKTVTYRLVTDLHVVFLTDDLSGAPPPPERAAELEGIRRHLPIRLQLHEPETQVIVCAALQRRDTGAACCQQCNISKHTNCGGRRKMYLAVDMTGQEGGTKHQVSVVIDQDSVTTECGLLIGQGVRSMLVWRFTEKGDQRVLLPFTRNFSGNYPLSLSYLRSQNGSSGPGSWT